MLNPPKGILIYLICFTGVFLFFTTFSISKVYSYFSKIKTIEGNTVFAGTWTNYDFSTPIKSAESVGTLLTLKRFNTLYQHLVLDLRQTISEKEFVESMENSTITGFEVISEPNYKTSNQVEVKTKVSYENGSTKSFISVFNYEDGEWKLLGTVESD